MKKNMEPKRRTYIALVTLILNHTSAQSISSTTSVTILNIADIWTMTGIVSMPSTQTRHYQTDVTIIKSRTIQICKFTYTVCLSQLSTTLVNTCQCTGRSGDEYFFVMRRQGSLTESQNTIEVRLDPTNPVGTALTSYVTIPLMYRATVATGSNAATGVSSGTTVEVSSGDSVTVDVELPSSYTTSYTLTVAMSNVTTRVATDTNVTISPSDGNSTATVTLATGGHTDEFTFNINVPPRTPTLSANPPVHKEGENIELHCKTSSMGDVTFSFQRDGTFYKTSTTGRYTILGATIGREYVTYTCTVTMDSLSSSTSNPVIIELPTNTKGGNNQTGIQTTMTSGAPGVSPMAPGGPGHGDSTTPNNTDGSGASGISSAAGCLILMTCAAALVPVA